MRTGGDRVADMSGPKGHAETTCCSKEQQEPAESRQGSKSPGHFADAAKFLSPSPSHKLFPGHFPASQVGSDHGETSSTASGTIGKGRKRLPSFSDYKLMQACYRILGNYEIIKNKERK